MRPIDFSQSLYDGAPNCPAHPVPKSERTSDHAGRGWRMEVLTVPSHTGSHLDDPLHKIPGGKSISDPPLETFVGNSGARRPSQAEILKRTSSP